MMLFWYFVLISSVLLIFMVKYNVLKAFWLFREHREDGKGSPAQPPASQGYQILISCSSSGMRHDGNSIKIYESSGAYCLDHY